MKRFCFGAAAVALLLAATLYAAEEVKLDGVKCVVAPRAAKAGTEVDYKGGKVFFCCTNCPKKFTADTAKFATKANHQLVATGQAEQVKCPLSGQDINPATAIEVAGTNVAFCCEKCQGKTAAATGDQQLELVFSDKAFDKAFKVGAAK